MNAKLSQREDNFNKAPDALVNEFLSSNINRASSIERKTRKHFHLILL